MPAPPRRRSPGVYFVELRAGAYRNLRRFVVMQ